MFLLSTRGSGKNDIIENLKLVLYKKKNIPSTDVTTEVKPQRGDIWVYINRDRNKVIGNH